MENILSALQMMFDADSLLKQFKGQITDLCSDSRHLQPGDLFLAYPGEKNDGRDYIDAAIAAGAIGVLWDAKEYQFPPITSILNYPVDQLRDKVGIIASHFYGHPSKQLSAIGITGTNGKTTISHFIAHLLNAGGIKTGVIGTLGAGIPPAPLVELETTTPEAISLQRWLKNLFNQGCNAVAIEASSHGIKQKRLVGTRLAAGVFANAGHDHLDYHIDVESYWESKRSLFLTGEVETAILNADDHYCSNMSNDLLNHVPTLTYGRRGDAMRLLQIQTENNRTELKVDGIGGKQTYIIPFLGKYNISNFLAAALVAIVAGIDHTVIIEATKTLSLPEGRLQKVWSKPDVYVDFAHTPDAMEVVLSSMRPTTGRLLLVFGCGGNRDQGKREQMGYLAASQANQVYITDDNPRDEDAQKIRSDILKGAPNAFDIGSRKEAIMTALSDARPEDIILVLGKGHERTQLINGQAIPFSDVEVIQNFMQSKCI